jgi:lipid-binding SYLF domain-containing protein
MHNTIRFSLITVLMVLCIAIGFNHPVMANSAGQIDSEVDVALNKLYAKSTAAKELSKVAKGILVFPSIIKGGLIVGGHYGEGALRKGDKTVGYYNTVSASYGLQIGAQTFGYALFFTDEASLEHLKSISGWEVGVGPTVVVVDEGLERTLSTTTAKEGIYAFFFDQKGLMAGITIHGSKITPITPN